MAEKGIQIQADDTGQSVAFYDAKVTDQNAVARVIQLVDQSQRKHEFNVSTEAGLIRDLFSPDSDATNLTTVPSGITSTAIQMNDANVVVAACHYFLIDLDDIIITPIVLDSNNAAIGTLKPKVVWVCCHKTNGRQLC